MENSASEAKELSTVWSETDNTAGMLNRTDRRHLWVVFSHDRVERSVEVTPRVAGIPPRQQLDLARSVRAAVVWSGRNPPRSGLLRLSQSARLRLVQAKWRQWCVRINIFPLSTASFCLRTAPSRTFRCDVVSGFG